MIMSNLSSIILIESGINELEIIEFYFEKVFFDGWIKICYYGINVVKVCEVIWVLEMIDYLNV